MKNKKELKNKEEFLVVFHSQGNFMKWFGQEAVIEADIETVQRFVDSDQYTEECKAKTFFVHFYREKQSPKIVMDNLIIPQARSSIFQRAKDSVS